MLKNILLVHIELSFRTIARAEILILNIVAISTYYSEGMSPDSEYTETHENKIYATLDKLGIAYQSLHHPAIMTMEEGAEIAARLYFMQKSVSD